MAVKIRVTQACIDNGVQKDSHHCMIADAIKQKIPTAQFILVDLQSIRWSDSATKKRVIYLTPPSAQQALLQFDRGDKKIAPFVFSVRNPTVRDVGWQGQRSKTASRKGKRYRKTGKTRAIVVSKEREFGVRKFVEA
jgi:hypothetical protein